MISLVVYPANKTKNIKIVIALLIPPCSLLELLGVHKGVIDVWGLGKSFKSYIAFRAYFYNDTIIAIILQHAYLFIYWFERIGNAGN